MPNPENLKPWPKGVSGNPKGAPKGSKHISTWIKEIMEDEDFQFELLTAEGKKELSFKGAPVKAIINVAIQKALGGDHRWAEWLGKHGYGTKIDLSLDYGPNPFGELTTEELRRLAGK